eukprot:scaffold16589_cov69-Phaeocystis_antarctica.AAC.5
MLSEELPREFERHLLQPAAGLVGRLPPGQPLRAHGCRRPVLRLQRSQDVRHQVSREQHALDSPERQRVVGGHALVSGSFLRRVLGAQPRSQVRQHVVRELAKPRSQPRTRPIGRHALGGGVCAGGAREASTAPSLPATLQHATLQSCRRLMQPLNTTACNPQPATLQLCGASCHPCCSLNCLLLT